MRADERRWGMLPTAPIAALIERIAAESSTVALAAVSGLDRRTLQRVATRPLIRRDAADRIAVALGRHPSEVWAEWFGAVSR